jgi:biotin/methionine sulfoxide reductase
VVRTVQTASHWGVYSVTVDDDQNIVGVQPFEKDPNPSGLIYGLPELVRSPSRIDQPYIREGFLKRRDRSRDTRGQEKFIPVDWSEALSVVEQELRRITEGYGNDAIYGGSYGWASAGRFHHAPSVLKRFLGLNGGYVEKLGNHSFGAAMHIMPYVIGRGDILHQTMPWPLVVANTRLIVMFGGGHLKNSQIDAGGNVLHETDRWFSDAKKARVEIINISPSRDDVSGDYSDVWLPIRPNTDVALMLALAHTLVVEGLHDKMFLEHYCEGYPRFEEYLLGRTDGQPKNAAWASKITDIAENEIVSLARRMAKTRTLITTSWSIQRAEHGEQPVWMTVTLAAILGQIGLPGGGFSLGLAAVTGIATALPPNMPRPTFPLGPNAVSNHVPVGQITDMLLNPGREIQYNGKTIQYPDIKLIYSAGGNPFHHNTNLNRFVKAWQRPDTVIVHEQFWCPAAKFADIVLPATTTLERNDIQAAELSRFYIAMQKAIDPVGKSRNDFDIFNELAERLGFGSEYSEGRDEMAWLEHMYNGAKDKALIYGYSLPSFDEFWDKGSYEFPNQREPAAFLSEFRADPIASRLKTPSGKIEIHSAKIDSFDYSDCPAHPTWLEPSEWLGSEMATQFPIHLISNQPSGRLHSQLDPAKLSKESKVYGREPLRMNAEDARERGLGTGDIVRVYNSRGAFISAVITADSLRRGVAQIATGAWYDPLVPGEPSLEKHGNPNVVTNDTGTSRLGQSSTAQTVLVEIERLEEPPAVTAFMAPIQVVS